MKVYSRRQLFANAFMASSRFAENLAASGESRPLDVPGEDDPVHQPDHVPSEVDLPPAESMPGRAREGVMVVMPALSEGEEPEEGIVPALVGRIVRTRAPQVAN